MGAAWVPNMFCNFYSMKNHKIVHNLIGAGAREKIHKCLESLDFLQYFDEGLIKCKNSKFLQNKISY
jgi:hypothetical protein